MRFLARLFRPIFRRAIQRRLGNPDLKDLLIREINRRVDLPKLDERQEEEIIRSFYNAFGILIDVVIDKL